MKTVEITIRNTPEEVERVEDLVATLAAEHNVPANAVFDMSVALDEILSNIIKYGYTDYGIHEIRVRLTAVPDRMVAEIEDDGSPFDPISVPDPDIGVPLAERRIGGLGLHFVRRLMSEVAYSRNGNRNRLVLRRLFDRGSDGNSCEGS